MADSSRFDFCPKCGALSRDGVCQSCGYVNQDIIKEMEAARAQATVQQTPVQSPAGQVQTENQPAVQMQPNAQQANVQASVAQGQPEAAQPSVAQAPVAQQPTPPVAQTQSDAQAPNVQQPTPPTYMQQPYVRPVNTAPMQAQPMAQQPYAQAPNTQQPTPPAYMQQPYARPVNTAPMQAQPYARPMNAAAMQSPAGQASVTQGQPMAQQPYAQAPNAQQPYAQAPNAKQPTPPAYMQQPYARPVNAAPMQAQPYARPVNVAPMQGSTGQTPVTQGQPMAQQPYAQAPNAQRPYAQTPNAQQPYAQTPNAQQPNVQPPNMQPPMYRSGYGAVPPGQYPGYAPAVPPAQPPKKKGGTAVAICILAGIVLVALVALILVGVSLLEKAKKEQDRQDAFRSDYEREEKILEDDFVAPEETKDPGETGTVGETQPDSTEPAGDFSFYELDVTEQNRKESGQDPDIPYYSGPYNSLRDDLSYEITFTEAIYYATNLNASVDVEYPQIVSDDMENMDYINEALRYEFEYYRDYFSTEYKDYMTSEEDVFACEVDSFVTYMDEKILSVVFYEKIALKLGYETYQGINFYCLNFNLEMGTLLENTEVLRLDEDFAVDFRGREVEENGEEALTAYSDQEILRMLKDGTRLVLFYTPMGLEVGLNLDERIVYVTYDDYKNYLNDF